MASTGLSRLRCSAFIATSLDGYIARVDGRIDWLSAAHVDGEDYGFKAFFDTVDVLVIGRKTYDTVLGLSSWPYQGKRCVVMTHHPTAPIHGEKFFAGNPGALVDELRRTGAQRVYVDGGQVIGQFIKEGILDDLTVSLIPVMLGSGLPLFHGGEPEMRVTLQQCQSWPSGVAQLRYRLRSNATDPTAA